MDETDVYGNLLGYIPAVKQAASVVSPIADVAVPAVDNVGSYLQDMYGAGVVPVEEPVQEPFKQSQSQSIGVGASESGINFDNLRKIQESGGVVDKRVAKRMAPTDAELTSQQQESNRIAGNQKDITKIQSDIASKQADIQNEFDLEHAKDTEQYQNDVTAAEERRASRLQSAMDTHATMMKDFMATEINPGGLWNQMTGGEKGGTGLSVFASAFLGAKGIETPVMDILNKAMDRNIQAQVQNLNKKEKGVQMAGDIVSMVRAQSATDREAELKLRDMSLESAKAGLTAQLSAFGSDLAQLKGQQMFNAIDQQQLATRQQLFKERSNTEATVTGQEIARRGDELRAAAASRSARLEERRFDMAQQERDDARKAAAVKELRSNAVWDTTEGVAGGKGWVFQEGVTDKKKEEIKDKIAGNSSIMSILKEAGELSKEVGSRYSGYGAKYLNDADKARLEQFRNTAVMVITREASGLAVTDEERKIYNAMLEPDTLLNKSKFDALRSQLTQIRKKSMDDVLSQYTSEMPEEQKKFLIDSGYGPSNMPQDVLGKNRSGNGGFGAVLTEEANQALDDKGKPKATPSQKLYDRLGTIKSDRLVPVDGASLKVMEEFLSQNPDKHLATYNVDRLNHDKEILASQKNIIELGINARAGDTAAVEYLSKLADERTGLIEGYQEPSERAVFAQFVLDRFDLTDGVADQFLKDQNAK